MKMPISKTILTLKTIYFLGHCDNNCFPDNVSFTSREGFDFSIFFILKKSRCNAANPTDFSHHYKLLYVHVYRLCVHLNWTVLQIEQGFRQVSRPQQKKSYFGNCKLKYLLKIIKRNKI